MHSTRPCWAQVQRKGCVRNDKVRGCRIFLPWLKNASNKLKEAKEERNRFPCGKVARIRGRIHTYHVSHRECPCAYIHKMTNMIAVFARRSKYKFGLNSNARSSPMGLFGSRIHYLCDQGEVLENEQYTVNP